MASDARGTLRGSRRHGTTFVPGLRSGVYQSDLVFTDEGNKDTINGLINFAKRRLTYNIILEIQQYQKIGYPFLPVEQIQRVLLQTSPILPAEERKLYEKSLVR